ncbi:hypothetical protein GCM10009599_16780 [Luteococcus peritonei]
MSPSSVKTMLRRGTWVRLGRNVFATHSGDPGWQSRAWAAALMAGDGAMLAGRSAGHLQKLVSDEPESLHVVLPANRRVRDYPGVYFERRRHLPRPVGLLPRTPPAVTVVDLCAMEPRRTVEWATTALRERLVSPKILRAEVDSRAFLPTTPLPVRSVLTDLLDDAQGLESPLEVLYRERVEKAHGLPTGTRQVRRAGGRADVLYEEFGLLCELDGRLHDLTSAVFRDLRRDNAASVDGLWTHRYGYHDVYGQACETAFQVATKLHQLGWQGMGHPCPSCRSAGLWLPAWAA